MSLIPFSYKDREVRVLDVDGEPWLVLNDLCDVLEIGNSRMVAARLPEDCVSQADVTDALGRTRATTVVSEAGFYRVVLRSDKPQAEPFTQWVTRDVLPAIRKTGAYTTDPQLTEDQIVHQALQITAQRVETLTARLALVEPKAAAFDVWLSSNVNYAVGVVAQALAGAGAVMGRQRLFAYMDEQGWIYRHQDQWHPYQHQVETKRLAVKLGDQLNTRTGERFATVTVRVTPKGASKLAVLLGVVPEIVAELLAAVRPEEAEAA